MRTLGLSHAKAPQNITGSFMEIGGVVPFHWRRGLRLQPVIRLLSPVTQSIEGPPGLPLSYRLSTHAIDLIWVGDERSHTGHVCGYESRDIHPTKVKLYMGSVCLFLTGSNPRVRFPKNTVFREAMTLELNFAI